jgi:hypothetical protein
VSLQNGQSVAISRDEGRDERDPHWTAIFSSYGEYGGLWSDGPADEALRQLVLLADSAPDEEHLAALAVVATEPPVDLHWVEIVDDLEDALDRSAPLRTVMRVRYSKFPTRSRIGSGHIRRTRAMPNCRSERQCRAMDSPMSVVVPWASRRPRATPGR